PRPAQNPGTTYLRPGKLRLRRGGKPTRKLAAGVGVCITVLGENLEEGRPHILRDGASLECGHDSRAVLCNCAVLAGKDEMQGRGHWQAVPPQSGELRRHEPLFLQVGAHSSSSWTRSSSVSPRSSKREKTPSPSRSPRAITTNVAPSMTT